jgi:hypothetical protein
VTKSPVRHKLYRVLLTKERPGLAGMEAFFVIDQNRSSANWPLAKILQRHGDAETGFKSLH